MREIKFRVWCPIRNKFIVTDELYNLIFEVDIDSSTRNLKSELIFSQYTGLKDCNGVEIYEGDIVKDRHYVTGVVEFGDWNNDACMHDGSYSSGYGYYINPIIYCNDWRGDSNGYRSLSDGYEVIGNVYENPELLRK